MGVGGKYVEAQPIIAPDLREKLRRPVNSNVGPLSKPEPFVECADVRWTESSSLCKRRIRLRHVATRSDLVAIWVRVSSRLRLPVA